MNARGLAEILEKTGYLQADIDSESGMVLLRALRELAEQEDAKCSECHGVGWTVQPDPQDGQASQVQCERCLGTGRAKGETPETDAIMTAPVESDTFTERFKKLADKSRSLERRLREAEEERDNAKKKLMERDNEYLNRAKRAEAELAKLKAHAEAMAEAITIEVNYADSPMTIESCDAYRRDFPKE